MYRILINGDEVFCDSRIDELAVINPVVTLEANTAGSFTFTVPPTHPKYDAIKRRKTVISVKYPNTIWQGVCVEVTEDFYKQRTYICEGELSYLNDSVLRPHRYEGVTVLQLLTAYINEHNSQVDDFKNFRIGNVTVADDYISCYTNMNSTMSQIKEDLVDDLGGYVRVRYVGDNKYIDYIADPPRVSTQTIELGKNLIDYSSNINNTDLATAIIPLGATQDDSEVKGLETKLTIKSVNSGQDYIHSASAVSAYGWIYKTVEWPDVTKPNSLLKKGRKYLSDIQFENVTITASAVDLGRIMDDVTEFRLLDSIHVISEPHGMDKYFTLTKQVLNLNNPEKDTITLGTEETVSLASRSNKTNADVLKRIEQLPSSSMMQSAIDQATSIITGAEGGYVVIHTDEDGRPYEILVMDTDSIDTAQKVWRWNQNGFGYSSTGYAGPYGLAMTMDGQIVADYIKTGKINAIEIDNGKFKVTKTGALTASNATINGDITFDSNLKLQSNTYDGLVYNVMRELNNQTPMKVISPYTSFDCVGLRAPGDISAIKIFSGYVRGAGGTHEYEGYGMDFNLPIFGNHAYIRNLHDLDGRDYQKKLKYTVESVSIPSTAGNTDGSVSISGFSNLLAIFPMGSAPGTSWNTQLHIKSWSNTTVNFRTIGSNTQKYTLYIGVLRLEDTTS